MSNINRPLTSSVSFFFRYEAGSELAGVIYIHRISDRRFTGIAGRNFRMFRELCGDTTLKNVVIITNMWGEVSQDVGEARENELITNFFKPVLDKGAQLARHHNTVQSAHDIIRRIIKNQPIALQIQRELIDERKDIADTAAGEAVNEELNRQIRRHQAELKEVREEMKALKEKDEEARRELQEETQRLQEKMDKARMDSESMASKYEEEKTRMKEEMRQMQEQVRQAEAAYKQQMDDLHRQLQERAAASAAEKEAMQQQIDQLKHQWDNRPQGGGCLIM